MEARSGSDVNFLLLHLGLLDKFDAFLLKLVGKLRD